MSVPDYYRKLASELRALCRRDASSTLKAELNHLAQCYVRLAEQADRNQRTDISYETSRRPTSDM